MSDPRARFPWGLTVATGLALVLLCGLGTWQVQRLHWKEALIAEAGAAAAQPPRPVAEVLAGPAPEFRAVTLTCPGLASAPFVELQTVQDGQVGVRLVSACRPDPAGPTFLVDRGFVADTVSARPPVAVSDTPVDLTAEVRHTPPPGPMAAPPSGPHFYARDTPAMARVLTVSGPVAAETLYATTSSNPDWSALQPSAPPAAFSNNHLGYALTWFGLALALLGTYVALLRRRMSAPTPEKSST
ncbi:SURF1 family protein [Brevundimonas sp. FT23028]|uniref:SURF1 family protein n=1 Tax=Brevundimonas sp. FT23028 TaxID=3393748 RepID=UPI003B58986A